VDEAPLISVLICPCATDNAVLRVRSVPQSDDTSAIACRDTMSAEVIKLFNDVRVAAGRETLNEGKHARAARVPMTDPSPS
jgi:hypothetical protein